MSEKPVLKQLRAASPTISVGILTADLMNLKSEFALLAQTDVEVIHIDVMDGCYVPMMTVGPPFIKALTSPFLKDAHLMIQDPLEKVDDYVHAGADIVTVHVEARGDTRRVLQRLGTLDNANDPDRGLARGVALNPATPLDVVEQLFDDVEMIVVLAVTPGVKGQGFDGATGERVAAAKEMIAKSGKDILLCVDGGITCGNIEEVAAMGADIVVSGSAVFDGKAPVDNARFMLDAVKSQAK